MPMGMEIVLGVVGPEATTKTLMAMFPELKEEEIDLEDSDFTYDRIFYLCKDINEQLKTAQRRMLASAGFTNLKEGRGGYISATTPVGRREFAALDLRIIYDPHEVGQDLEDICFGIALSSRYYPRFLDWKYPSGGSVCLAFREDDGMFKIARKEIGKVVPWIEKDADICATVQFY